MTIPQYEILIKALNRKNVDKEFYQHRQAFLNFSVQSQRKAGKSKTKPVYNTFKKFYDYEKRLKEVENMGKKSKIFRAISSFRKGSE